MVALILALSLAAPADVPLAEPPPPAPPAAELSAPVEPSRRPLGVGESALEAGAMLGTDLAVHAAALGSLYGAFSLLPANSGPEVLGAALLIVAIWAPVVSIAELALPPLAGALTAKALSRPRDEVRASSPLAIVGQFVLPVLADGLLLAAYSAKPENQGPLAAAGVATFVVGRAALGYFSYEHVAEVTPPGL